VKCGDSLEHPQILVLTDSLKPLLTQLFHPRNDYFIVRIAGCTAVDRTARARAVVTGLVLVPDVPPKLGGRRGGSYVLLARVIPPLIALDSFAGEARRNGTARLRGKVSGSYLTRRYPRPAVLRDL